MKTAYLILFACVAVLPALEPLPVLEPVPLRVLLLSGSNNHDWKATTPVLVALLEATRRFTVAVRDDVQAMSAADFLAADLVVSNFNLYGTKTDPSTYWDAATRQAFSIWLRSGKGLVCVHAGSSVWNDWPDFAAASGGRWGSTTHHARMHDAPVAILLPGHPIVRGFPSVFTTRDEFWEDTEMMSGVTILARATPRPEAGGSDRPQPMAWTTAVGSGRGFTLLLGHDAAAMARPGFTALFVRGCEWAATGQVTLTPVP